jgi:hypothetical protein
VTSTSETLDIWVSNNTCADEEAVADFRNPVYKALLADLKKTLGVPLTGTITK